MPFSTRGPAVPSLDVPPAEAQLEAVPARPKRKVVYWCSLGWIIVLAATTVLAGLLPLKDPNRSDFTRIAEGPSLTYWLGTDEVGRDIFARVIYGARVSLLIGIVSVILGMVVGGMLGMIAGYVKGRIEGVIVTITDALLAFPALVLLLTLAAVFGQNLPTLILGLALLTVPTFIRLTRANTLVVSQREFVVAAKAYGSKSLRVMLRDVAPNVMMPLMAYCFIIAGVVIVAEGSLSFLGLGLPPPTPSWGGMIAGGRIDLDTKPHIVLMPGLVMFLTVLAFTMVGEHLRRGLDVREGVL